MPKKTDANSLPGQAAIPLRADRLADSVLTLLAMTAAQRVIGFVRGVLFCRWLEPEHLGQWDMAFGFLELAAPLAVLGIPGSFGRYVEHYRQQGQLGPFLRKTTGSTAALVAAAVALAWIAREKLSYLVFGTAEFGGLVALLLIVLCVVIAHNFCCALLTALRRGRLVARLQFVQSLGFAVAATGLLLCYGLQTAAIVVALGLATLISAVGAVWCLRSAWSARSESTERLSHGRLWPKLLPFAVWVWGTNWLANAFELADRYVLIHFGGLSSSEALVQVGNYHSSRVVPLVLVSVAGLIATLITPYLSRDWEAGRRRKVDAQMNLTLKLLGLALFAACVAMLLAAPLLFGVAFRGKYDGGLAVLPATLTYCCWLAMARTAQKYLWCAEKVRLATIAWIVGLAINIALNVYLAPRYGLPGVVTATSLGNLTALVLIYLLNRTQGMRPHWGTCAVAGFPLFLWHGPQTAAVALVAVGLLVFGTERLLSAAEKRQVADALSGYLPWRGTVQRRHPTQENP